jgi:hypothetical protein
MPIDRRQAIGLIAIAAVPTIASLASAMAGWWDAGNSVRAAIGVPLGATAGVIVAAVLAKDLR